VTNDDPKYEIEFFRRTDGTEPVRRFLNSLSDDKRNALVAALMYVLGRRGLDVCRSEWGRQLGKGLAEFRLRHDEAEIFASHGPPGATPTASSPERILLRVFFHVHDNRLILLLSGYDKGIRSSVRHQQREIERARVHLKEWQAQQTRRRRITASRPRRRR
jgi:hypothetical protein